MFIEEEYVVLWQYADGTQEHDRGYTEDEAWEVFEANPDAFAIEKWETTWDSEERHDCLDRTIEEVAEKKDGEWKD